MVIEYVTTCRIVKDALSTRRVNVVVASKDCCPSTIGTRDAAFVNKWPSGVCASAYIDVILFTSRRFRIIGAAITNTEKCVVISSVWPDVYTLNLVGTGWVVGNLLLVARGKDVVTIDSNLSLVDIAPIRAP